jgi:xanthosine utilization system XapX-like protein
MMVFTTLFAAGIIIGILYSIVRVIPWAFLSYAIMVIVGVVCLMQGTVHLIYIGLEVIGLGCLVVWYHYKFIKPKTTGD